jgi:hypothetical protein
MNTNIGLTIAFITRKKNDSSVINFLNNKGQYDQNNWNWDDAHTNKSKKGDIFAFYCQKKMVYVHQIQEILPSSERPPEWDNRDRNVLCLGPRLIEFTWDEWINNIGKGAPYSKDYRSTQTTNWDNEELTKNFPNFIFNNLLTLILPKINNHIISNEIVELKDENKDTKIESSILNELQQCFDTLQKIKERSDNKLNIEINVTLKINN